MKKNLSSVRLLFTFLALFVVGALAANVALTQESAQSTTEIPLGGASSGGGLSTMSTADATATDQGGGPESLAFDGTYVWVTRQFRNALIRLRASDGSN